MNKKFLPDAVLFIIAIALSNLAFQAQANTFYGEGAGTNITTGGFNSGFGYFALFADNSGGGNTAIGDSALEFNTTGNANTASGLFALYSNTIGNFNTATGPAALFSNTAG